jgi:hypothetical protein
VIELLMELLDSACAQAVRRDHLLQSRFAHIHECEFSGHEERVCRDQQYHDHDAQHNESNHEAEILPSARGPQRLAANTGSGRWQTKSAMSFRCEKNYRRVFFAAFFAAFFGAFLAADLVVGFAPRFADERLAGRMGCISHGSDTAL